MRYACESSVPYVRHVPIPYAITRRDDGVLIEWVEGGTGALYPARKLRLACPCADCVEEMSGRAPARSRRGAGGHPPVSIALVGAYGLRVGWSDGHGTGIYTFERLPPAGPAEA